MLRGAELLVETIQDIKSQNISPQAQNQLLSNKASLRPAPKIHREDCQVNWNCMGQEIYNFIRGLSPYPGAWTKIFFQGQTLILKIYSADFEKSSHSFANGMINTDNCNYFKIAVSGGFITLINLQLEGKKRLPVKDFLNGVKEISNARLVF